MDRSDVLVCLINLSDIKSIVQPADVANHMPSNFESWSSQTFLLNNQSIDLLKGWPDMLEAQKVQGMPELMHCDVL